VSFARNSLRLGNREAKRSSIKPQRNSAARSRLAPATPIFPAPAGETPVKEALARMAKSVQDFELREHCAKTLTEFEPAIAGPPRQEESTMRDLNEMSVTDAVLEQMAGTPDARLREVMASLVSHLHDFARDVHLTPQEWLQAIGFLTKVGQACTPARQEFILLSDVLGLSALVNLMHDKTAIEQGTESSLLGPFYRQDAPSLALGDTIAAKARGNELLVYGRVTDRHGKPLPRASVQVWQTDEEGVYDLQKGRGETMDMRGNFQCDAAGRFHFRTVKPLGYLIPMDGPVGKLVHGQGRHGYRPAHIHFLVGADGYRELVTALYLADDAHIDSDTVFGVSNALITSPREYDPEAPVKDIPSIRYDFRLAIAAAEAAGRVGADPSQIVPAH
jgi:protocatechuate 3,4-dioxygenase beta subunit